MRWVLSRHVLVKADFISSPSFGPSAKPSSDACLLLDLLLEDALTANITTVTTLLAEDLPRHPALATATTRENPYLQYYHPEYHLEPTEARRMDGFDATLWSYSSETLDDMAGNETSHAPSAANVEGLPPSDLENTPAAAVFTVEDLDDETLKYMANSDPSDLPGMLDFFIPSQVKQDMLEFQSSFQMTSGPALDLHQAFHGFFGDDEVVLLSGTKENLDSIRAVIARHGRVMARCNEIDLAMRLMLEYGVSACRLDECLHQHDLVSLPVSESFAVAGQSHARPIGRIDSSNRDGKVTAARKVKSARPEKAQSNPLPVLTPASTPSVSSSADSMPAGSLPAASATSLPAASSSATLPPAVPVASTAVPMVVRNPSAAVVPTTFRGPYATIHPLAGRPKPATIPDPIPKPKGVSYASWDNAHLYNGLTDDQIISGWVHPDDIQGTLAVQVAETSTNTVVAKCIQALQLSRGEMKTENSAITKRWTLAVAAQCKRNGNDLNAEKARISAARKNGRSTADDLLLAIGPPAHSDEAEETDDSPDADQSKQRSFCSCSRAFGEPHDEDCTFTQSSLPLIQNDSSQTKATSGRGKRKRATADEQQEDELHQAAEQVSKQASSSAFQHQRNDSGMALDKHANVENAVNGAVTGVDDGGQGGPNAKRQKRDAKKKSGWVI